MKLIITFICLISSYIVFSQSDTVSVNVDVVPNGGVNQLQLDFSVSNSANLGVLTIRAYEPNNMSSPILEKVLSQADYSIINNHFFVYLPQLDPLNNYSLFIELQDSYGNNLESFTFNYIPH